MKVPLYKKCQTDNFRLGGGGGNKDPPQQRCTWALGPMSSVDFVIDIWWLSAVPQFLPVDRLKVYNSHSYTGYGMLWLIQIMLESFFRLYGILNKSNIHKKYDEARLAGP